MVNYLEAVKVLCETYNLYKNKLFFLSSSYKYIIKISQNHVDSFCGFSSIWFILVMLVSSLFAQLCIFIPECEDLQINRLLVDIQNS